MLENIEKEQDYAKTFCDMVEFVRSLGLTVNTKTKARGHQGFFLQNRIDISSTISDERKIEVLIHEFTHFIHFKMDKNIHKTHGDLSMLFPDSDLKRVEKELKNVTRFVDTNKGLKLLAGQRDRILAEIKELDKEIKQEYPDFKRSYPYKRFDKAIKSTDAKYLLKYDRVQVKTVFSTKIQNYSIKTIDEDFPKLEPAARKYILIKSKQRTLKRIAARTSRLNSYYKRPTELFARFVEALFVDTKKVSELAPHTYLVFCSELSKNRYLELADFINNFF